MPLNQQIEGGNGKGQPGLQVVDHPMHHLFHVTDQRQHGIDRFDQHAVIPGAARTDLEVGRIAGAGMEPGVAQDQHPILEHLDQRLEQGIVHVGRRAQPTDDAPQVVDQQAQLVADDPAVVGEALAAHLARTAPFPNGVNQFDTVTVDYPQQGGLGQKSPGPPPVGHERPEQPGALGQLRKQGVIVPAQPAIEDPVTDPFERVQHPQGHHLAGPKLGLGMFGEGAHLIIDPAKQLRDKVNRGHGRSPFSVNLGSLYRLTWRWSWPLQLSLKN